LVDVVLSTHIWIITIYHSSMSFPHHYTCILVLNHVIWFHLEKDFRYQDLEGLPNMLSPHPHTYTPPPVTRAFNLLDPIKKSVFVCVCLDQGVVPLLPVSKDSIWKLYRVREKWGGEKKLSLICHYLFITKMKFLEPLSTQHFDF